METVSKKYDMTIKEYLDRINEKKELLPSATKTKKKTRPRKRP